MSVGPILTLGLGNFTGGGVKFLPTLGYATSGTPPPPPVTTRRHPGYDARAGIWREDREIMEIMAILLPLADD